MVVTVSPSITQVSCPVSSRVCFSTASRQAYEIVIRSSLYKRPLRGIHPCSWYDRALELGVCNIRLWRFSNLIFYCDKITSTCHFRCSLIMTILQHTFVYKHVCICIHTFIYIKLFPLNTNKMYSNLALRNIIFRDYIPLYYLIDRCNCSRRLF